jgi:hypothetical protein
VKLRRDFDQSHDIPIELRKLFSRYPVFRVNRRADFSHAVTAEVCTSTQNRVTNPAPLSLAFQSRASVARRTGLRALMLNLPHAPCGRYAAAATPVLRVLRGAGGFLPGGT